jgi:hypothetical protein
MLDDLLELEALALSRADVFQKDMSFLREQVGLTSEPVAYRPAYKDDLLRVIDDLDRIAAAAEALPPELNPAEATRALDCLGRVLQIWAEVNATVDFLVGQVLRGTVDRGFQLLSPIANNANLRGRRQLVHVYDRLADRAQRSFPSPEQLPDLVIDRTQEVALPDDWGARLAPLVPMPPKRGENLDYPFLFVESSGDAEELRSFEECLGRLSTADELDRNDALAQVLTRYQPELVAGIIRGATSRDEELGRILGLLWRNAEMVILEDFFFSARRTKLTSFLVMADPYPPATLFRRLLELFRPGPEGYRPAEIALERVEAEHPDDLPVFLRALLVHPLEEYRRYAIARLDPFEYWSVVSYPHTPTAALADILDRLAQPDVLDDFRKVFFDCTQRTLGEARGSLEVKATRRILNTLFSFDFFMEDDYFQKILDLNAEIEREEARLGLENPMIRRSIQVLKEWKDKLGPQATRPPSFSGIPLTLQRKLAREGLYLLVFVCHPNPKIALETVRFINTPGLAEQVARLSTVSGLVLLEITKREELFRTQAARMTLLSNPKAPIAAAQRFGPLLSRGELVRLSQSKDVNPEVAAWLRSHLAHRPAALDRPIP